MELVKKIVNDFNDGKSIHVSNYFEDIDSIESKEIYTEAIKFIHDNDLITGLKWAKVNGKYIGVLFDDKAELTEKGKDFIRNYKK